MNASRKPTPDHLSWLINTNNVVQTNEGNQITVLELNHTKDDKILRAWAKHFRSHYCDDGQIDSLRSNTRLSRRDYLLQIKFPDSKKPPGPSIRAGDFGEILVMDYLEFAMNYIIPRIRYDRKAVRNESTKGSDIIGFKIAATGQDHPNDSLVIFEAKAKFSGGDAGARLQEAVDGSAKDETRKAESLNAIKQRYIDTGNISGVATVERFQNPEDRPYKEEYGAVALFSSSIYNEAEIALTTTSSHPHHAKLTLIVVRGPSLMDLVHELYRRAADEA